MQLNLRYKNFKNNINYFRLISFVFSILIIVLFLYPVRFSLPSADDFSMILHSKNLECNRFFASLITAVEYYKTWSGDFICTFIQTFILSFYKIGIVGLHFFIGSCLIFFFISLYYFTNTISKNIFDFKYPELFFFFILLIGLNTTSPNQFFYWATGILAYTLYFSLTLLFLSWFIKYVIFHENKYYILCIVSGIIITNVLPLSGIINFILLLYFLYSLKMKKDIKKALILFLCIFIFSCAIAFAPGNFNRHNQISSDGMHFFYCIFQIIYNLLDEIVKMFTNGFLLTGMIFLFIVCITINNTKITLHFNPIIILIFMFLLCFVFLFPVELGYSGAGLPNRILIMLDLLITICALSFSMYTALYLKNLFKTEIDYKYMPLIFGSLFFVFFIQVTIINIKDTVLYKTAKEIKNGSAKEFYLQEMDNLLQIKKSLSKDVTIIRKNAVDSEILVGTRLCENPKDWVNSAIASFYGKDSITYIQENN